MHELMLFLVKHWPLTLALVVVFVALVVVEFQSQSAKGREVSPQGLVQIMNQDVAVVLDIRDETSFRQGHIINAINITLSDLDSKLSELAAYKQRPIVVVCYRGVSAGQALKKLSQNGFESVQILSGGIKAWQAAGLPLEKE